MKKYGITRESGESDTDWRDRYNAARRAKYTHSPNGKAFPRHPRDISGYVFGRVTAIDVVRSEGYKTYWRCRCSCGGEKEISFDALVHYGTKSCGCLQRESASLARTTHGKSKTARFSSWQSMISRCENPNMPAYENYGARGIMVCDRWHKFENFWEDMGPTWVEGLSLDRIDNDGNYEPENCRWATIHTQSRNRRSNVHLETPKGRMIAADAAKIYGVSIQTLCTRAKAGWTGEELISTPHRVREIRALRRMKSG